MSSNGDSNGEEKEKSPDGCALEQFKKEQRKFLAVSNHLNPATNNHIKCRHFGEAQIGIVGSAVSRRWELTDAESAQDGGTSGNHRTCAAELVVSPDRR
jgi:hypothetical protein